MNINKTIIMAPLFLSTLIGCANNDNGGNEGPDQTNTTTEYVGINIEKVKQDSTVSYTPPTGTYYGKLKVTPKVYKPLIQGPEAQQLRDHLFNMFGSEKNEFVITFNAKIKDVSLPPAILFVYKYDSEQKKWFSKIDEIYTSPIFNISSHDEIEYTLNIQSSRDVKVDLFSTVVDVNKKMKAFSSGSWVMNLLAEPVVTIGALKADKELGRALTNNYESEINSKLFPLSKTESGVNSYKVKSTKQQDLANINIEVEYYSSLVLGGAISHSAVAKAKEPILPTTKNTGTANPRAPSNITVKRYGEKDRNLLTDINKSNPSLIKSIQTTKSSSELDKWCSQLISELESKYDLNNNDINFVIYDLLSSSSYVTTNDSFNANRCLTPSELTKLAKMGLPLEMGKITINTSFLNTLSGYLRTPKSNQGYKASLENYFLEWVYFESDVDYLQDVNEQRLTKKALIEQLGKIGANRAGGYNLGEQNETVSIIYNHHNELDKYYKITLNYSGSGSNRIGAVKLEYAHDDEMSKRVKLELAKESKFENESTVKPTSLAINNPSTDR